jgi:peptidyl-prolyl cis-trans isomerase B (cyclophilin B)
MKRKDREMISRMKSNISKEDVEKIRKDNVAKRRVAKRTKVRKNLMVFGALILIALIAVGVVLIINNAGESSNKIDSPVAEEEQNIATVVTSKGDFKIELLPKSAPETVANFKKVAGEGHYDNSFFHRIIKGDSIECAMNENSGGRTGFDDTMPVENSGLRAEDYFISTVLQPGKDGEMKTGFFKIHKGTPMDSTQVGTVFAQVILGTEVVDQLFEGEVVKHEAENNYDIDPTEISFPANPDDVKIFSITFSSGIE